MALGVEAFTILGVLEAKDMMSEILERVSAAFENLGRIADGVADDVGGAGGILDDSLLNTASGVDAVVLANARLEASASAVAAAQRVQADAQTALISAQAEAAGGTMDEQEAQTALAAALKNLTDANTAVAAASRDAAAAQADQAAVMDATAAAAKAQAEAEGVTVTTQADMDAAAASSTRGTKLMSAGMLLAATAVAGLGYESVKAAANFQDATTHLVTDAGENKNALAQAQAGILQLSAQTGTSADDLVNAMYHIDSAGYHVANGGLQVLKIAAEGAKVGGADLDTVSKTLVGSMNALGISSGGAASMMNQIIATVGAGDMRMQDLASSISAVLPVAAAAKLTFAQVGGAIATMTSQGMSADQASQDLANTIRALQAPTASQIKEMQSLGLNSNQVQMDLGKQGLTGTITEMYSAIAAHQKDGQVFISALQNSKAAAADANIELKQLPTSLQATAKGLLNGTVTAAQWSAAIKDMGVPQKAAATQFEALVKKTGEFNSLLTSGSPSAQTFNQALEKLMGNATAMNTALLVGGTRMATYNSNVATIAAAAKGSSTQVANWSTIQGTFNQKMDELKESVSAAGISIGTVLIPPVTKVADVIIKVVSGISEFVIQNKGLVTGLLAMAAGAMAAVLAYKAWLIVLKAWKIAQAIVNGEWAALDALMDASPIMLIVVAIGALVGALIYCWFHFKAFRDVVEDVWDFIKKSTADVIGFVEGHWREIISIIGGPLGVVVALVTKYWRQIYDSFIDVWHALDDAFHTVVSAVETVWHAITTVWGAVWGTTKTVWDAIIGFFKEWWPLLLAIFLPEVAVVISLWNHFHKEIIGTVMTVWNAVVDFLKTIWNAIVALAKGVWDIIEDAIIKPVEAVWNFMMKIWNAIKPYLESAWNWIKNTADAVWNDIYEGIVTPIKHAWDDLTRLMSEIETVISSGLHDAWKDVENIGQDFELVGEDIINGIVHGIENVGSEVGDTIKNIAHSALNDVKSFLGIGSPSKVFASEVGQWIPEGIGQGITGNTGAVKTALQGLAKKMPGMINETSGLGLNLTGAYGGTGVNGANGGVIINLDMRGSQVMSDSDMKNLANKVGRVIATQMLPAAGVRIRS